MEMKAQSIFTKRLEMKKKVIQMAMDGKLIPEIVEQLEVSRYFVLEVFEEYKKQQRNNENNNRN